LKEVEEGQVLDGRQRRVSVSVMAAGAGHCIRMALEESMSKRAAGLIFHFHKADGETTGLMGTPNRVRGGLSSRYET
jgi:hypothetical protein